MNKQSIQSIAKEVGVAPSTVSRVLNGGSASAKTIEKVEAIIKKNGYQRNSAARALRTQKSYRVGVIVPDIENPAYACMVRYLFEELKNIGYQLILGISYGSWTEEIKAVEMMWRENIDGLLLHVCEGEDDTPVKKLLDSQKQDIPMVTLGKPLHNFNCDSIYSDDEAGWLELLTYIKELGHTKIAYLSGATTQGAGAYRFDCFKAAMRQLNLDIDENLYICDGEYSILQGKNSSSHLLDKERPDTILCANDLMAIGALAVVQHRDPRIAITGFDDTIMAASTIPSLTTLAQPFENIAKRACFWLNERMNGSDLPPRQWKSAPRLIMRNSTQLPNR